MGRNVILTGILLVLIVGIFVFVWPTMYRYDHIRGRGFVFPVRVHRITGATEVLYLGGWKKVSNGQISDTEDRSPPEVSNKVPADELSRLNGQASIKRGLSRGDYIEADIYNGSSWVIKTVTIRLAFENESKHESFSRDYSLSPASTFNGEVKPLHAARFSERLGFTLEPGQTWRWNLVAATGHPAIGSTSKRDLISPFNKQIKVARHSYAVRATHSQR
jgi:hypothetical protein